MSPKTLVSEAIYDFKVEKDVMVPMRDGTRLAADVYLPKAEGTFPVLIERTPYNKEECPEIQVDSPRYYSTRGYGVVIQDVRGRFASEGNFIPFHDDGWGTNRDGYDTVEWAASQRWSNGKIGMIGGSYSGATQYRLAPTRPPHLVSMFARESSSDYHAEWVYRGGAFELGFSLPWSLQSITLKNLPHLVSPDLLERKKGILEQATAEMESWYRHRPLGQLPLLEGLSDWYNDWLAHPDDGPYWWRWNIALKHNEIDVPIYHLGGWYDIFLRGTLENFIGISQKGMAEKARSSQRLIIGPWVHGPLNTGSKAGEMDFGPEAAVDLNALRLRWFDHWLKGMENGLPEEPPVKVFVMGRNKWREEDSWPLKGTRYTKYHLRSGKSGSVRSLNDGLLDLAPPSDAENPDSYLYDPANPTPTMGGCTLSIPSGPFDQRKIDEMSLTYTTAPLTEDLEVVGAVKCVLYALSSAPDTDWVVRLTDVYPDGRSMLLADGILRARYRDSREHPSLIMPNRIYRYEIDLWATANLFKAGHRIRVAVASSSFPRWDPNLNTGGDLGREVKGQVALNTIFHDVERASYMILPVVAK